MRRFLLAAVIATAIAPSAMAAPPALRLEAAMAQAVRSAVARPVPVAMPAPMRPATATPALRWSGDAPRVTQGDLPVMRPGHGAEVTLPEGQEARADARFVHGVGTRGMVVEAILRF